MTDWQDRKRWSDRFLTEIKGILGVHLIGEPPMEEDAERNTDLMVLRMDAVRIGVRIRSNKYLGEYGDEFTIRAGLRSGVKTELTKIIEGWGDFFFYGFCDGGQTRLVRWTLADMKVFRRSYMRMLAKSDANVIPGIPKDNTDGGSSFAAFRWGEFPPEFIVARSVIPTMAAA